MAAPAIAIRRPAPASRGRAVVPALAALALAAGALAAVKPAYGIALVLAAVLGYLLTADVTALPVFLVLTMFVESLSVGSGLTIGRLGGALALVVVVVYMLLRGTQGLRLSMPLFLAGLFGMWLIASALWAQFVSGVTTDFGKYALVVSYLLTFAVLVRTPRQLTLVLSAFAWGALLFGLVAIAQYIGAGSSAYRAGALQGDPNTFAVYQVMSLPAVLTLSAFERRPGRRLVYYTTIVVILVSIAATLSRTGLVTLAAVVLLSIVLPWRAFFRTRGQKATYFFALLGAGAVGAVVASSALLARINESGSSGDRGSGRIDLWAAAFHAFHAHPWLGIGAGNFPLQVVDLLQQTPGVVDTAGYVARLGRVVHNSYIELLTELGVVGFTIFVSMMLLTAYSLVRSARRARAAREQTYERFALTVLAALVAFAVAAIFLSIELNKPFWIILGLALAIDVITRNLAPVPAFAAVYAADVRERPLEERERELAARESQLHDDLDRLERRRRAVNDFASELRERTLALARREQRLVERERQLITTVGGAPPPPPPPPPPAVEPEPDFDWTEVEREPAPAVEPEPEPAPAAVRPEPEPEPVAAVEPEPEPEEPEGFPAEPPGALDTALLSGRWHIATLERLNAADPAAADERGYYVYYLADFADADGWLDPSFDPLVAEVFGELIDGARPA
jgi:O-antigen ligase